MATRPLAGITVVDLGGTVATAACGRLFADFGARVIDLEPPGGFETRRLAPLAGGESALHGLLSPSKESAIVASEADALRWCAGTDIVLDFGPPRIRHARIHEASPRAIVGALSWHGLTGPLASTAGSDATIAAQVGWIKGFGKPGDTPRIPAGFPLSLLGGVTAFIALSAELTARELGRARANAVVDVSVLESAMCLTEVAPIAFFGWADLFLRLGLNRFPPNYPATIYATREGWLGVTALTPKQWRDLCALLDLPEAARDPRFRTYNQRLIHGDAVDAALAPVFLTRSADEWVEAGQARRIPLTRVHTPAQLLASPQLEARGSLRDVALASGRTLRAPSQPFRLTRTPALGAARVAKLGECGAPPSPRTSPVGAAEQRAPLREPTLRPDLLRGVRILDLTMGWAGPLAGRHLADLGAEVIKIESRQRIDWWRGPEVSERFLRERLYEKSVSHNMVNRNKLGITLDFTVPRGRAVFERLVAEADAVIENFSAGVMDKLGLGERELLMINPRLAIVTMPPFGRGGPMHEFRAYGSTVEQASGLPHQNGNPDEPPTMSHIALGDPVAGVHGAAALALALLHVKRTGEGQLVDLSQAEALTSLGVQGVAHQALLGEAPPRLGNRHASYAPQGNYRCAGEDQWLTLTVTSDAQWLALRDAVGDSALFDPALEGAAARRAEHERIDAAISAWALARERDDVVEILRARGIPAAGVHDVNEVLLHPQLEARGFWQWIEREVVGTQPSPSAPHRTSDAPHAIELPAPLLGEHTREVLGTLLALSGAEMDALEAEGVIGTEPSFALADGGL
ncbi:MAG: CoA transferase [Deltaproteobacteria bacterium]|nr:CoA transferase [Deltaproteobacteria bacterium]